MIWAISVASAVELEVAPGQDWCLALRSAPPGGEVVLLPGNHPGKCEYVGGGVEGAPVVLRAKVGAERPRMVFAGGAGRYEGTIRVNGDHLRIEGLGFGPSGFGHAVEIVEADDVEVRSCWMQGLGGLGVVATAGNTSRIQVVDNTFVDMHNTAIYLGCHSLDQCGSDDYRIVGNRFQDLTAPVVGMAMHLNVDSWGVVSDNVMSGIQGPGIQVFGSRTEGEWTIIERNVLFRSETTASMWISGGPVIARNNVVLGGYAAGILAEDIEGRDLQTSVHILGNTIVGDQGPAIDVTDWFGDRDLELVGNAVWQEYGEWSGLPEEVGGTRMAGNVICGPDCWADAEGRDLSPASGGPLRTDDAVHPELTDDLCGAPREWGVAGALVSAGPGSLEVEADWVCSTSPVLFPALPSSSDGCGCASGGGVGPWVLALLLVRRRSR